MGPEPERTAWLWVAHRHGGVPAIGTLGCDISSSSHPLFHCTSAFPATFSRAGDPNNNNNLQSIASLALQATPLSA